MLLPLLSPRAFLSLDLLPVSQHFRRIFGPLLSKNVRMPPHHLLVHLANHIGHGESPFLRGNLRVKHNLQQQIAHLVGEFRVIAALHGVQDFVGLFNQVSPQRRMRLLAVPRTPVRRAQTRLQCHQPFEPLPGRQFLLLGSLGGSLARRSPARFTFFQLSLSGGHLYPQISAATNVSLYSPGTYFDKRANLAEAISFPEEPVHAPIDSLRCIHHTASRREHHPFRRSCCASSAATPAARE